MCIMICLALFLFFSPGLGAMRCANIAYVSSPLKGPRVWSLVAGDVGQDALWEAII